MSDMGIELERTENSQVYDVKLDGNYMGEITNKLPDGKFSFKTEDLTEYFNAQQLRAIADRLDELNGT